MRQIIISLDCPKRLSTDRVVELLGKMIDVAQRDAEKTLDRNHQDKSLFDQDANDTVNIIVNKIVPI